MKFSFVFVPRMHEDISDCYRLLDNKITQNSIESKQVDIKNAEDTESVLNIDIAYFNPFLGKIGDAIKKYMVANPEFPWKKEEAYQYIEDFRKSSLEYGKENQRQLQSYFATNESELTNTSGSTSSGSNLDISNIFGLVDTSIKRLNQEEELALDSFVRGGVEYEKKIFLSDNEDIEQKRILEQAQKVLILAWLQEEQDMDLFVIQQKISQKEQTIKHLLQNPYESKLLDAENSPEEINDELYKYLREKEEEIKKSFSFNVLKEKQSIEKNDLSHVWNEEDFNALEFSTVWRKLFFAQLHFMPEDTLFIVNDRTMCDDLVNIALDSENKSKENRGKAQSNVQFDDNINDGNYEQEEVKKMQKICSQTPSHYSFLSCPLEMIFREQNKDLSEKYKLKELRFLLKRN